MAVITGLLDPGLIPGIAPQTIAEIVIAVIIISAGGHGGQGKNFRRIGGADATILNRPLGVWGAAGRHCNQWIGGRKRFRIQF